ncbi:hypothetical protein FisN_13Lh326 [Fistulifera solaris]|uniref:Uncharacterized protein n=1 Tax=Fistulifera solaris TaxID=1519565 RepID=A0A1Z5KLH5_FISSO|nr:hypothetical protein FisN_13Lh326 [Fistulifera solaris]|eukprot:GAX27126.1 hypothetical protein FisN_13Lh326 [Fistulifera solaris]
MTDASFSRTEAFPSQSEPQRPETPLPEQRSSVQKQTLEEGSQGVKRSTKKGRPRPWRRLTNRFQRNEEYCAIGEQGDNDSVRRNHSSEDLAGNTIGGMRGPPLKSPRNEMMQPSQFLPGSNKSLGHTDDGLSVGDTSQAFVSNFEIAMRQLFLISSSFVLGTYFPVALPAMRKIAEYTGVAWLTCLCILGGTWMHQRKKEKENISDHQGYRNWVYRIPQSPNPPDYIPGTLLRDFHEEQDLVMDEMNDPKTPSRRSSIRLRHRSSSITIDDQDRTPEGTASPGRLLFTGVTSTTRCVHPSLEPFFVIDAGTQQRIFPNVSTPYILNTDYFDGKMMILIRTPDVDDPTKEKGTSENSATCNYMSGKQRRFEFQFQIKLKKVPTGRVYFACEIGETIRMGMIQRAFVSAAMAFVKTTNNSFHYSITGSPKSSDGKFEKPHMAFPVEEGMNRVVATPPGQEPPSLGEEIFEDPESIKNRKKGIAIKWNLDDTYTLSLWSAYVDFLDWHCCNLPGIRPFGMNKLFGNQPIYLTLYEIPFEKESEKHNRCDITNIVEIEMCHTLFSETGNLAKRWMETNRLSSDVRYSLNERIEDEDGGVDEEYPVEEDDDENAAAELGEGIYVRSGEVVTLKETVDDDDVGRVSSYLASGGGFGVLQEQNSCSIVIQKARGSQPRRGKPENSGLIKDGDTVLIKLVGEDTETKFLSLHRGWWLKWVASVPTKNGFFTIHANERGKSTQSSYLNLDGSFYLRHKRWSKYLVGVSREGSTTYGGRMLGLYNPKEGNNRALGYSAEDDELLPDADLHESDEKDGYWMYPLFLEICDVPSTLPSASEAKASSDYVVDNNESNKRATFLNEKREIDAPAWIEVMNRAQRVSQLAYVVRVMSSQVDPEVILNESTKTRGEKSLFMRLRTGRDLSRIMRAGIHWRNSDAAIRNAKRSLTESGKSQVPSALVTAGTFNGNTTSQEAGLIGRNGEDAPEEEYVKDFVEEDGAPRDFAASPRRRIDSEADNVATSPGEEAMPYYDISGSFYQSDEDSELTDDSDSAGDHECQDGFDELESLSDDARPTRAAKGRNFIGKIAQSVKSRTASTGKKVVRHSMRVGKGTVNAGKAIISGRPRNVPPQKEPRSAKPRSRRRAEKDLHLPLNNRAIKRAERVELQWMGQSAPLAGELSAPEQSCRVVSSMLTRMSTISPDCAEASKFNNLLSSQILLKSQLDKSFLQGGPVELGVTPSVKKSVLFECLVARCLWESHWREEWCGLYEKCIAFYAPLSQESSCEISLKDIEGVRLLDPGTDSPIPGYPILTIETAWHCHYMVLNSDDTRASLKLKIDDAISSVEAQSTVMSQTEAELRKARLWQRLQSSSFSSVRGKWADVHCNQKLRKRVVLNHRRMAFDLPTHDFEIHVFIESLLATALSFEFDSLQHHPEALTAFLDSTSVLKGLRLQDMDRSDPKTFCAYVNVYHCLLQHALLVTANGPLTKRSHESFMRTSCYEIGGDIFSLAELSNCIIRGNMCRPNPPKAPYTDAPKKSNSYRCFALPSYSPNVNFVVHTGDTSCSNNIPVLQSEYLADQVAAVAAVFLRRNVSVDRAKRTITIPKVLEVFRNDFPSDVSMSSALSCLRYCLRFLDEGLADTIYTLLQDEGSVTIKYRNAADQYHSRLSRQIGDFIDRFSIPSD